MSGYQTRQEELLFEFLREHQGQQLTIDEIISGLGSNTPGKSTVYRLMARLTDEGEVQRFAKGDRRKFLYQFVSGSDCSCHLHLRSYMRCSIREYLQ